MARGVAAVQILCAEAARSSARQDSAGARAALLQARTADPSNVWVLHDSANALLAAGSLEQADATVTELLRLAPTLPEAQIVRARLLAAEGDEAGALAILSALPAGNASASALRRKLELQVRIPQLVASDDQPGLAALETAAAEDRAARGASPSRGRASACTRARCR